MPTDLEKLLVRLEVSQRKFEKQLANASRTADRRANNIEKRFNKMNRNVSRGFDRIGASAGVAFRGVSRFAAVALGALGTRELTRYADAWTRVENQIRAAEQISGTTARTTSRLVDLANESRSGLEETADLYGRLLRVSNDLGASEEQVAQATETVAKAFKAGGAAASEQASGILQLGQALGSGFLQGDELRSLRENAPLVAQAIAKEFETTVGGLKDLGAEGELTADRVFKALLNAQQDIEKAFSVTTPLVADGFTALRNGITEVVAAFSEGSGAGENLAITLQDLGTYLSENTERARIFGARVSEALKIIGEVADSFTGTFDGLSQGFEGVTDAYVDSVRFIIDAMQSVIAAAAGVGVAISTSMLNAVDAVNNGATGIVNAGISAINQLLAAIIADINTVVSSINNVISTANRFGANIGTLGLIDAPQVPEFNRPTQFGGDAVLAYREARDSVRGYLEGLEKAASDSAAGRVRRVLNAGRKPTETGDPRGDQLVAPARPQGAASTQPAKASPKGGGGGGRRGSAAFDLTGLAAREMAALEDKIALLGLTERQTLKLEAAQRLLAEAKKRGLDLDRVQAGTGKTLREEIDAQAESIANLAEKYEAAKERADFFKNANEGLKDGFLDAIVEGESLSGVLEDLAKKFARAALEASLFGSGPFSGGGGGFGNGGGLLGNLFGGFGKLLSFDGGGFTGAGGRSGGIDGRGGFPAILHPNETVIDHTKKNTPSEGGSITVYIEEAPGFASRVRTEAQGVAVQVVQSAATRNEQIQARS